MQFFVQSNIVVVGYDAEMADMSNPRGAIHGESFYVVAESRNGRRWAHYYSFTTTAMRGGEKVAAKANSLRARIERNYAAGVRLDPKYWTEIDPCYGSDAYVQQGIESQRAEMERQEALHP
jgi:hypothetical protein